jgi:hypothetical protein
VTPILFVVVPLAVFLYVLIFRINHAKHFAPQAYYRRKARGASIAFGFESLAPRPRKRPPAAEVPTVAPAEHQPERDAPAA